MVGHEETIQNPEPEKMATGTQPGIWAAGGIIGAIAASSCCILPLILFSLGISGAWMGNLRALEPYQPVFLAVAFIFIGYGFYLVYIKPKAACADGEACAKPMPNTVVKTVLWIATALVIVAAAFPYIAPVLLDN